MLRGSKWRKRWWPMPKVIVACKGRQAGMSWSARVPYHQRGVRGLGDREGSLGWNALQLALMASSPGLTFTVHMEAAELSRSLDAGRYGSAPMILSSARCRVAPTV